MEGMTLTFMIWLTICSYEELEPSASLHNAIFKIMENHSSVRNMVGASSNESHSMLTESFLIFCQMTRQCGDSDDLLFALAKTGFLEQKFANCERLKQVYPAILAERAEILWKRHETSEAVQSLRSLLDLSQQKALSFSLVPKEIILAKLVRPAEAFY